MNLSWIIQQAVLGDKQRQAEAEAAIVSLRNQNMEQFMLECAVITNSETENEVARQTAATILGRSLFLKVPRVIFRTQTQKCTSGIKSQWPPKIKSST